MYSAEKWCICRGAYCAATVARLTGVATGEMFDGTAEWIVRYFAPDYSHILTADDVHSVSGLVAI